MNKEERILKIRKSEYMRTLTVDEDEILLSFDVTSLYTNVPMKDKLVIIKDILDNGTNLYNKTIIPPDSLLDINKFLHPKT